MLQPDQVYASLNGIVFGDIDEFGVDWSIDDDGIDGWSATSPTTRPLQRARRSGSLLGSSFASGRNVSWSGSIFAPNADLLRDAIDRLNAAVTLTDSQLSVTEAGLTRWAWMRQADDVITRHLMPTIATYSVQLTGSDWRKFGATMPGTTSLPTSSGGFSFPLSFPLNIPATVASGLVTLTNRGNDTGPVRIRIDGPVTGPSVRHAESGKLIALSPQLSLADGEYLVIDPERQEVLANGQASRNTYLTSRQWFGFDPGGNTYAFAAANNNSRALLSVEATEAWR